MKYPSTDNQLRNYSSEKRWSTILIQLFTTMFVMAGLYITFLITDLQSYNIKPEPAPKSDKIINLAIQTNLPPYFIQEHNSGMELELIRAGFAKAGYDLNPLFNIQFQSNKKDSVDCFSTTNADSGIDIYFSHPFISHHNAAVSLSGNDFIIHNIDELANKQIIAYKNASQYLGGNYKKVTNDSDFYREILSRESLVILLFSGRIDVIVNDVNNFRYNRIINQDRININKVVNYHFIFNPVDYGIGCYDQNIVEQFNKGLEIVKQEGIYDTIVEQYHQNFSF